MRIASGVFHRTSDCTTPSTSSLAMPREAPRVAPRLAKSRVARVILAECQVRRAASACVIAQLMTALRHPSARLPVKGVASPDGENAGHLYRSSVGQGCASSHCFHRHAKLSGLLSSRRNHMSLPPHSMFSLSHFDGAERPRSRWPFERDAMVA